MSATRGTFESAKARIAGWLFAAFLSVHSVLLVILPRLEKEAPIRDLARSWHYFLGIAIFVFAVWRTWLWIRERGLLANADLPGPVRYWISGLTAALLGLMISAAILGPLFGWAEGRVLDIAGLFTLPELMGKDHQVWAFTGYFHSALSTSAMLVALLGVLTAAYTYARYGMGLFGAFAPYIGWLFVFRLTVTIYALNSFAERKPGYIAAAIFVAIVIAYWLIVRALRKGKAGVARPLPAGRVSRFFATATIVGAIVLGLWGPNLLFRVSPIATGEIVRADPSITWHRDRVAEVTILPPDAFEGDVAEQTYKWCKFCHTMEPGAAHLVGPNLYNIFGQQAATVPNFHYSPALAKAGREGLIWDDETIAQYIANPDDMVPGTTMIISSGPIPDPKVQAKVVNLLKRDTMVEKPMKVPE